MLDPVKSGVLFTVDPVHRRRDRMVVEAVFGLGEQVVSGAVTPDQIKESERTGKPLPSLHSSQFAPAPEPTIKTGVNAMTAAVLGLAGK